MLYMIVISLMAWLAVNRYLSFKDTGTLFAMTGAILFMTSDTVLAFNRFKKPFRLALLVNLATYFAAQLLIASSF